MGESKESDVTYHPVNDTYEQRGYVTRVEWGARPPVRIKKLQHPISYVCISYNDTTHPHSKEFIRLIQKAHIERGMWDIQSNFIVATDGTLYEGRGWDVQPSKFFDKYEKYNGLFFDITILGKLPGPVRQEDKYFKEMTTLIAYGLQNNKIKMDFEFLHDKEGLIFLDEAQRHALPPKNVDLAHTEVD